MAESTKAPKQSKIKRKSVKKLYDGGTPGTMGTLIKIALLGILDAFGLFIAYTLWLKNADEFPTARGGAIGIVVVLTIITAIYLKRGNLPGKYMTPGIIFLIFFQLYVVMFSGYISFTNYGSMNNSDQKSAINALRLAVDSEIDGSKYYGVSLELAKDGKLAMLATELDADGMPTSTVLFAEDKGVLAPAVGATDTDQDGIADTIPGYSRLTDLGKYQDQVYAARFFESNKGLEGTYLRTEDGMNASEFKSDLIYSEKNNTFTKLSDGTIYKAANDGFFRSTTDAKDKLEIGWIAPVGFKNYATIFGDPRLRGPLAKIISWTVIFAFSSVASTFIAGLALALLYNRESMKGKRLYRSILILPYAFPGFLSAYVWKGLFNTDKGFINNVILSGDFIHKTLLHGHNIPWLTEEGPARWAVLLTNLWLGFPYMFLITTGALQAIPSELTESALIDGATPWQQLRLIKFPLLMVTLAPLLVASFAYNFNNFTLIYLLTGGGPTDVSQGAMDAGGTDILITFVYKIAFSTGHGRDFGLASAFSVLIFLLIGTISVISFRRTRTLEDVN
jgi:arabinogalactan oligomer/maltooligosaccharide transport system permease protein